MDMQSGADGAVATDKPSPEGIRVIRVIRA